MSCSGCRKSTSAAGIAQPAVLSTFQTATSAQAGATTQAAPGFPWWLLVLVAFVIAAAGRGK